MPLNLTNHHYSFWFSQCFHFQIRATFGDDLSPLCAPPMSSPSETECSGLDVTIETWDAEYISLIRSVKCAALFTIIMPIEKIIKIVNSTKSIKI